MNGTPIASYNADDQLVQYDGTPYTYAADGSLASVGATTYRYDALGHLLEVKTPSETITYTYDGLGRRVGKAVNGTLVQGFRMPMACTRSPSWTARATSSRRSCMALGRTCRT